MNVSDSSFIVRVIRAGGGGEGGGASSGWAAACRWELPASAPCTRDSCLLGLLMCRQTVAWRGHKSTTLSGLGDDAA